MDGLTGATDFCFDKSHSLYGTADCRTERYAPGGESVVSDTEQRQFDNICDIIKQYGVPMRTDSNDADGDGRSGAFYIP